MISERVHAEAAQTPDNTKPEGVKGCQACAASGARIRTRSATGLLLPKAAANLAGLVKIEGQLLGRPRMLLPPKLDQQRGKKPSDHQQVMNDGVVARAQGDQQPLPRQSGLAVMDMQRTLP